MTISSVAATAIQRTGGFQSRRAGKAADAACLLRNLALAVSHSIGAGCSRQAFSSLAKELTIRTQAAQLVT